MTKAFLLFAVSVPLLAFPTGAPIGRTGAPGDGTCISCHQSFELNPAGGSVRIQTSGYKPGLAQAVRVTVSHPEAQRWGFEITARWAKDLSRQVGRFSATNADVQPLGDGTYATHTANGTTTGGSNGAKTFEFEFTPPTGAEDGDIVFYAAGNAANNNNQPTGDRIYTTSLRVPPDNVCTFTQGPVISTMNNSGSGVPGAATNTLISIYGNNLSSSPNSRTAHAGDIRDNNFPKELSCIAVEVNNQLAPILHVQRDQINVQVPSLSQTGPVQVRVLANPGRQNQVVSSPATLNLSSFAPAFFTFNGRSISARVANSAQIVADPAVVMGGRPARPGEIIELYGTGLGATQPAVASGAIASQPAPIRERLTVTIGGTTLSDADVLYAGLAPGNISGLYQVNVRIPASASNGDLPVVMSIGGVQSADGATIPVRAQP